jgi:hypothetical protein
VGIAGLQRIETVDTLVLLIGGSPAGIHVGFEPCAEIAVILDVIDFEIGLCDTGTGTLEEMIVDKKDLIVRTKERVAKVFHGLAEFHAFDKRELEQSALPSGNELEMLGSQEQTENIV